MKSFLLISFFLFKIYCFNRKKNDDIVDTIEKAFNWVESVANNGHFKTENTGQNQYDLYSGSCGVIMFCLEMYNFQKKTEYLDLTREIADDIISNYDSEIKNHFDNSFFHSGKAGVAFTFYTVSKYLNDTKYHDFFNTLTEKISSEYAEKDMTNTGIRWGSAGTGLYLLRLYEENPDKKDYLNNAIDGAELLLKKAKKVSDTEIKWLFGGKFPTVEMPNYAAGTAGISHFYLKLHAITKDQKYLDTALKGANYLTSIANTSNDGCLIWFNSFAFDHAKYYLGECNGNSGTGKFWIHLYNVTKDEKWMGYAVKTAKSLLDYLPSFNWWIPKKSSEGYFWNNMGVCDGSSAVIELLFLLNKVKPDKKYDDALDKLVDNIMSRKKTEGDKIWFYLIFF